VLTGPQAAKGLAGAEGEGLPTMNHERQPIGLLADYADAVTLRCADFTALIAEQIAVLQHQLAIAKAAAPRTGS